MAKPPSGVWVWLQVVCNPSNTWGFGCITMYYPHNLKDLVAVNGTTSAGILFGPHNTIQYFFWCRPQNPY
jgi:hypothetical protein